jgi:hypothetical protein
MMEISTDTFLSTVDRASRRLGPISGLITRMVDYLVPVAVARADSCPPPCMSCEVCKKKCVFSVTCCPGPANFGKEEIITYATTIAGCTGPTQECSAGCQPSLCGSC